MSGNGNTWGILTICNQATAWGIDIYALASEVNDQGHIVPNTLTPDDEYTATVLELSGELMDAAIAKHVDEINNLLDKAHIARIKWAVRVYKDLPKIERQTPTSTDIANGSPF